MAASLQENAITTVNKEQTPPSFASTPTMDEEHMRMAMAAIAAMSGLQARATNPNSITSALTDPMSPYFLHPSESPGLALVSTPVTESNYHFWSQAMTMALDSKNKMGFIDGSLQEPALGDPLRSVSERNNTFVRSWIVRSLSIEIAQSVLFVK